MQLPRAALSPSHHTRQNDELFPLIEGGVGQHQKQVAVFEFPSTGVEGDAFRQGADVLMPNCSRALDIPAEKLMLELSR